MQDVCTTMCAFDREKSDGTGCHFTIYDSNSCYLGTLSEETDLFSNAPVTIAVLHLKDGKKKYSSLFNINP